MIEHFSKLQIILLAYFYETYMSNDHSTAASNNQSSTYSRYPGQMTKSNCFIINWDLGRMLGQGIKSAPGHCKIGGLRFKNSFQIKTSYKNVSKHFKPFQMF